MAGGQRLISWFHPYSTSNVALNTRTCAHGPLMGHPNWVGCDRSAHDGSVADSHAVTTGTSSSSWRRI
jgi:hypothetical protein